MRLLLAALALLGASVAAQAQETWALPDGKAYIATSQPAPEVRPAGYPVWPISARLSEPTDRYSHDVLGGIPRWGALSVTALACADCRNGYTGGGLRLPEDLVFEDTGARLWDVTGDGIPEIVVVESHVQKGARLTAYHLEGGKLRRLASTPPGSSGRRTAGLPLWASAISTAMAAPTLPMSTARIWRARW